MMMMMRVNIRSRRTFSSMPTPSNDFFKALAMSLGPTVSTVSDVVKRGKRTVLEVMAKRMSPDDARIMLQHFALGDSKSLEQDIQKEIKTIEAVKASSIDTEKKNILPLPTQNKESMIHNNNKEYDNVHLLHPIFGKLVTDLGFKQVYLTNVKSLIHAPVWEKQRILRPERCARIASSKIQKNNFSLPGVISMYCDKATGKYGIVDGQHRAGALLIMAQQGHWNEYERNILVDVFVTQSEKQISELFREINSAEPVRLVDMPDEEGMEQNSKEMLDEATDLLMKQYPEMFKASARCKIPHLNVDLFRDDVFQSELITNQKIKSSEALLKYFLNINEKLSKRSDDEWLGLYGGGGSGSSKSLEQALKKAKANKFFLGLDRSWLHR